MRKTAPVPVVLGSGRGYSSPPSRLPRRWRVAMRRRQLILALVAVGALAWPMRADPPVLCGQVVGEVSKPVAKAPARPEAEQDRETSIEVRLVQVPPVTFARLSERYGLLSGSPALLGEGELRALLTTVQGDFAANVMQA